MILASLMEWIRLHENRKPDKNDPGTSYSTRQLIIPNA